MQNNILLRDMNSQPSMYNELKFDSPKRSKSPSKTTDDV